MHMLGWILFGLVVGIVAKFVMGDHAGFMVTTLLGIAGAFVGGYVGQMLGLYQPGQPAGFFMAVLGAMVLLFIYHLAFRSRTTV